ncbi:MAG: HAD hydrolase family protein [Coriobacteriales bacterium]|jgi:hydroxymethylpyrimidine pyrophosphatase-like HAD family hydrolase
MEAVENLLQLDGPEARETFSKVTTVYTDLDGTLLAPGGKLLANYAGEPSSSTADAIVRLRKVGVEIIIVTGRSRFQGNEFLRLLDAKAFIGEMGTIKQERGAGMLDIQYDTGKFKWNPERYATPYDAIADSGAVEALMERYPGMLEPNFPRCLNRDVTHAMRGYVDVEEVDKFLADNGYALEFEDNGMLFSKSESLAKCPEVHGYHIVPAGTSKAISVKKDIEQRGLSLEETVSIGDGPGDVLMGANTGSFVFMVNGFHNERCAEELEKLETRKFVTTLRCCDGWVEFANAVVSAKRG